MVVHDEANAAVDAPAAETTPEATAQATLDAQAGQDELRLARELVLRAHPEIVQELVTGASLAEMLASVPAAEAAYARVVAAVRDSAGRETATAVPGGGAVRSAPINLDGLGPMAKIRAGINQA
jgi:hypothetical protein